MARQTLVVIALAVVVTACGSGSPEVTLPATPSATPSATAAPTAAPTPTPVDIPAEFARQMRASTETRSVVSGTVKVGRGTVGEIAGTVETQGNDTHEHLVITFPERPPQETEKIIDGDALYTLQDGVWMRTELGSGADEGTGFDPIVDAALNDPGGLVLAGTMMLGGDRLHRLEIEPAPEITAQHLGFTDPTVAKVKASLSFLAEDDGTPAGMVVRAKWVQGEDRVRGETELRFRFDWGATDVRVTAPDDPWQVHSGGALAYRMALPVSWTASHEPASGEYLAGDRYFGTVDDQVQVVAVTDLQGVPTTEEWFRVAAQGLLRDFGSEPRIAKSPSLGEGSEVRIVTLHFDEGGDTIFLQQAIVIRGGRAWHITWFSFAGNEKKDARMLLKMLRTFETTA